MGLRDRGLDTTKPIPSRARRRQGLVAAVKAAFDHPVVHRYQLHKVRNVESRLPRALASTMGKKMRAAYHHPDALAAEATLGALARSLVKGHPGAAGSLREGLARTIGRVPSLGLGLGRHRPQHLHRYLVEFDSRYSTRKLSDTQRMYRLMRQTGGRRLTYKRITAPQAVVVAVTSALPGCPGGHWPV